MQHFAKYLLAATATLAAPHRRGLLLSIGLFLSVLVGARAQQRPAPVFFQADAEASRVAATAPLAAALFRAQALTLDTNGLRAALATAPLETQAGAAPLVLALPLPNGGTGHFALREAPIMAPALAAQFPDIKTYAGIGLDDAAASVRLDLTPQGFHAQVLTGDGQSFYIDPVTRTDTRHYLAFYKQDMNRAAAGAAPACGFSPTTAELNASNARVAAQQRTTQPGAARGLLASGTQLRTYRLALANTGQYALTKGNTTAGVVAAEATTVNRVVGVYEKELAVRLVLVATNNRLVFLSGTGPQPPTAYTNSDGLAMLDQNQSNIDALVGNANYDIGHVFSTGGGGIAGLGVVCDYFRKAEGVTGLPNPVGDAFDIDFVAHEMGHQFSGNHPFNGDAGGCAGTTRKAASAWEPGSGSTIMAYAGTCGSNNLQSRSDPTFHTGNYQEMRAFIDGTTCGTTTATGNTPPVVMPPASGKTLPIGTPFKLTATATDADGDALTYMWEELDLGPQQSPTAAQADGVTVPLFRSFVPLVVGTRYFPTLTNLVSNTTVIGERLPTVTRTLTFRCTARDQHSGPAGVIGGVDYSSLAMLNVTKTAGPFLVTAPNTAVTWPGASAQTVTWDVAGTTANGVNCALVNIRLSLDGGLTYPTLLAANALNTGTVAVVTPIFATTQTQARIMVEAADNYFFDISNVNFTIAPPVAGPTISSFTPTGGLAGTVVVVTGTNFMGTTAVKFNGTAAAGFTVNSATQLTATVAAGTATGPITATAPLGTGTSATSFVVGAPPVISSFAPAVGAVGATVVITGTGFSGTSQVRFNGTFAPGFVVNSATQLTAVVPAGATTGPITATTPTGIATSATSFTVIDAPVVTSFSPTAGPAGTVVVITGSYLLDATQVAFNGAVASGFVANSATRITVPVPAGATTGPIAVTGPGGTGTSAASFTVRNDNCADAIALTCGQTVAGSTVDATATGDPTGTCNTYSPSGSGVFYTVVGTGNSITVSTCNAATNFDTMLFVYSGSCGVYTCVTSNDDDASCAGNGSTSTVTFASVLGTVYRVFVSGYASATGSFVLSVSCTAPPTPTVTGLSPNSELSGRPVTLTGTRFVAGTTVRFGGVAATGVVVNSATSITATVPAGAAAGSSPVVVTANGVSSVGQPFTVLKVYDAATACLSSDSYVATGDGQWHYLLAGGQVVAALQDTRAALGTVSVQLQVTGAVGAVRQDGRSHRYLDRNFRLTATSPTFTNSSINVRFYALSSEMARLQAADATVSYAGLKVTQYSGPNEDCELGNNSATGQTRNLPAPATTPGNGVAWLVAQASVADHFSEFFLTGSPVPLPVELLAFAAEQRGAAVLLSWRTASEKNSDRFEVERSPDGQLFERVGTVAAAGSSSSPRTYELLDPLTLLPSYPHALLYYRLRQVDLDGTAAYSPVRTVRQPDKASALALFPNPAATAATLTGATPGALVQVFDMLGRMVLTTEADATGRAVLRWPAQALAAGVYLVRAGQASGRLSIAP